MLGEQDMVRLRHMRDATRDVLEFTRGRSRDDLGCDRMLAFAVVRGIEIIGEAAAQVSKETQTLHRQLPWADIVGMRNRLIHGYADVDPDRVWVTVCQDLPKLLDELLAILGEADQ